MGKDWEWSGVARKRSGIIVVDKGSEFGQGLGVELRRTEDSDKTP